jgi:hypothetical protein
MVRSILEARRAAWQANLVDFECRDVYPRESIERYCRKRQWLGHTLESREIDEHLRAVETCLRDYPNYRIGILEGEELYFNFLIEGNVVFVEGGTEFLPEPERRHVGGLQIHREDAVRAFYLEFQRLWGACTITDPAEVIAWLRDLRHDL